MNLEADTITDVQREIRDKAAFCHVILDELSDRLDDCTGDLEMKLRRKRLREKIEQLRVHVRMLKRSRSRAVRDLEAGIALSIEDIRRSIVIMETLADRDEGSITK